MSDLVKRLLGYEAYSHIKYQSGEGTQAPRFVYVDADYEVGDGNCGLHSCAKQTNEPAIPYARVDALLAQAARIERLEALLTRAISEGGGVSGQWVPEARAALKGGQS